MSKLGFGLTFSFISVFLSALFPVVSKELLKTFTAYELSLVSLLIGSFIVVFIFGAIPEMKNVKKLNRSQMIILILVSLLSGGIAPLLFMIGLAESTATNAVLFSRLETVLTILISAYWLKEKITREQIFGMIVIMFGIFLLNFNETTNFVLSTGDTYILIAALAWAISTNAIKKYLTKVKTDTVVLFRNLLGFLTLSFMVPLFINPDYELNIQITRNILLLLITFVFLVRILPQYLWYYSLKLIPASKASNMTFFFPLLGVAFAVIFLGEELQANHIIGGLLILGGMYLAIKHHQKNDSHIIHLKLKNFHH